MSRQLGFTLLEVLVAMTIIAIAFTALLQALRTNTRDLKYIEDKSLAELVAANIVQQVQVGLLNPNVQSSGEVVELNKRWLWQIQTDNDSAQHKVIVDVFAFPHQHMTQVTEYM